ncbi:MAG TPA: ATP-dependent DNA helicase [Steroidobacteraceae bacterium]|nr:ATP-dependent DNA helicase [Steroidobacteraceae bacterium]
MARALADFRARPGQLQLAEAVSRALQDSGWLVAEAGTGIGKTFAYLVPALLSGLRVIISTGTRTLQDQLFHRDLPLLARALGRPATVALLKGRANYLCRERLLRLPAELPLEHGAGDVQAARIRSWSGATVEGDLAELPELPDGHPLRERITSTRDSCTGTRCAEYARCHVFAARRRAAEADVVVVNHHLLLADLALKEEGWGDILPGADAVIMDEAHQLPELAAQFFGQQFGSRGVEQLLSDLPALLLQNGFDVDSLAAAEPALRRALQQAQHCAADAGPAGQRLAWENGLGAFDRAAGALVTALCDLADALTALGGGEALAQAARRAGSLAGDLDALLEARPDAGARLIVPGVHAFSCQLLPFEVGGKLRPVLQAHARSWIFTSATLAIAGDFTHFIARLGLAGCCGTLAVESPFDYQRQALLYTPSGMPDPASPHYADATVETAAELVELAQGGAFVLFTSHRALQYSARALRKRWGEGAARYRVLVQGESPREQLLREFREHGDAVLLGTASFREGVDVPGSALRLVVIDRLPFASPEDPLVRARLARAREQGGDPFTEFQLPEAAILLRQGVGRLIRGEQDRGVVAILDPRLTGKGYGRRLLASLPPLRQTRDLAEVRAMLVLSRGDAARRRA